MLNIVIPMAGEGSRFKKAGYKDPKPFIDVAGLPMIERVMQNLRSENARYILIARREHIEERADFLEYLIETYNAQLVVTDSLTKGTACTVLLARDLIDNEEPVRKFGQQGQEIIKIDDFIADAVARDLDGSMLTFIDEHRDPKWSFARLNEQGLVVEVKEKQVISEFATVGIYYFARGMDFVASANEMISVNDRVNNEFYTCPVYNYLLENPNKKVGIYDIKFQQMHGIGTPDDLKAYLRLNDAQ